MILCHLRHGSGGAERQTGLLCTPQHSQLYPCPKDTELYPCLLYASSQFCEPVESHPCSQVSGQVYTAQVFVFFVCFLIARRQRQKWSLQTEIQFLLQPELKRGGGEITRGVFVMSVVVGHHHDMGLSSVRHI